MGFQKNRLNETVLLWVLKRAPKTYIKTDGWENIYNFMLKKYV